MDRIQATLFAVACGLIALLTCTLAYGLGAGPWSVYVGLIAAPVVTLLVYRELRS